MCYSEYFLTYFIFLLDKQIGTIYKWYYQYKIIPNAQLKRWPRTMIETDTQSIQSYSTCRTGDQKRAQNILRERG